MRPRLRLLVSAVLLSAICGCAGSAESAPSIVGGPCAYRDIPGWARIVSIQKASRQASNCPNNPVVVRFDFIPADPKLAFKQAQDLTLTVGAGMNPARSYVAAKGIVKGKTYRCVRREIIKGTCTPVLYAFPTINLKDFDKSCYAGP
ncbi:MAG: hypothetical protein ABFD81_08545 [Syntrophaceae bacterium]